MAAGTQEYALSLIELVTGIQRAGSVTCSKQIQIRGSIQIITDPDPTILSVNPQDPMS
jgi:hypothetical protein